ncbi:MAG: hypothetical protein VW713_04595 [Alphaproteobacteria bacterium]|jgi:hypothetical protein
MTDAEILQSKIDLWHLRSEIEALVRLNTPSRVPNRLYPKRT